MAFGSDTRSIEELRLGLLSQGQDCTLCAYGSITGWTWWSSQSRIATCALFYLFATCELFHVYRQLHGRRPKPPSRAAPLQANLVFNYKVQSKTEPWQLHGRSPKPPSLAAPLQANLVFNYILKATTNLHFHRGKRSRWPFLMCFWHRHFI